MSKALDMWNECVAITERVWDSPEMVKRRAQRLADNALLEKMEKREEKPRYYSYDIWLSTGGYDDQDDMVGD